ncbi:BMP family ABC transporter substrate-binding protein [Microbacterium sp. B35-04]|uniref:BMP family ABC transporter substrate-binding protein n=1 Tax=Microbacterium sp. B35-04 TaxID=1961716 RepID=UPI0013D8DD31|nr:BMP family ABC transporter substrate-binding protein [Microbacterium sp. B35-04]
MLPLVAGLALAASIFLTGCAAMGSRDPLETGSPTPDAHEIVPEPGRTIAVTPSQDVEALAGYRIAVVTRDGSATSTALLDAAHRFAQERRAELLVFPADVPDIDGVDAALDRALAAEPDLIVGLGAGVVDLFSFETAQLLEREFLIIGAQLAEPTDNVTAVIWDGATSRGSAASADGALDDSVITEERGVDAFAVGAASIDSGVTGVVLRLE